MQGLRPDAEAAVGGETLIGKADSDGRRSGGECHCSSAPFGAPPMEATERGLWAYNPTQQMALKLSTESFRFTLRFVDKEGTATSSQRRGHKGRWTRRFWETRFRRTWDNSAGTFRLILTNSAGMTSRPPKRAAITQENKLTKS